MNRNALLIVIAGLGGLSTQALADVHVSDAVSGLFDDSGGRSLDEDATFSAANWWDVSAGIGDTRTRSAVGTIDGTTKRVAADLAAGAVTLQVYYKRWDATPFTNQTFGGRLSWSHSGLTLSGVAESRDFDVEYSPVVGEPGRSTAHFAGQGYGGGLKYVIDQWSVGADAIWYHFGSLATYTETQTQSQSTGGVGGGAPGLLPVLPIISGPVTQILPGLAPSVLSVTPSLTSSVVTLDQGALKHIANFAVGRDFDETSIHVDWTNAKDIVLNSTINNYSATLKQSFATHFNVSLTAGVSDSSYGSTPFGGMAIGLTF